MYETKPTPKAAMSLPVNDINTLVNIIPILTPFILKSP